jgi:hypothetical protein
MKLFFFVTLLEDKICDPKTTKLYLAKKKVVPGKL